MSTPNLAKIKMVDLKEAWPHEALDFTPWLADNIAELGEALGMNLKLEKKEATVGDFSLDILATDNDSGRPVIIENQLEATNHDHLGKLLTYAAGFDSYAAVWVTRAFRDEHRQAIDWLNRRTDGETQFFGVVVELWRIENSPYAPHFKLVATPNDWKPNTPPPPETLSGKFRQSLRETCDDRGIKYRGKPGGSWSWLNFEYPIKNVRYTAIWHKGKLGLEMRIERPGEDGRLWNQKTFEALQQHHLTIDNDIFESEADEKPVWESVEKQHARVAIYRPDNIYEDVESWDEFQDWMIQKLYKFREVFTPRLQELLQEEQSTIE